MLFEFNTRGMPQILEGAGVDFVVIDMEHSSFTLSEVADMIAWFKATRIAPFVRVPEVQYSHIARVMDAGALGVVAPNIRNAAQAQALVDAAKYAPLGNRGFFYGGANFDFKGDDPSKFRDCMDYSNKNTSVICLIESPEGIQNLEEIASTKGVDGLWVGWVDLSQSMGIPGQLHNKEFLSALKRTVKVAKRKSLAAVIQPGSSEQLKEWLEIGFNAISFGADFYVYREAMTQKITEVRKAVGR